MFKNILIPGRHHLLTQFQFEYLANINKAHKSLDIMGEEVIFGETISLLWAVTSANHKNTRRNPVPSNKRESAIEMFSTRLDSNSYVYAINDIGHTDTFASYVLKEIAAQSNNQHQISPKNTLVACSTPSVINMYEALGYRILPVELINKETNESEKRPWDFAEDIIENPDILLDSSYTGVHESSKDIILRYGLNKVMHNLYADAVLGDEGDLTDTRDYETYREAFEDGAERKYELLKRYIQPGKILDVGCATGEFIKKICEDEKHFESDIYGVEIARQLFDICQQRKSNNEFSNENVFFYQQNIMQPNLFSNISFESIISISLTHEIESYIGRESLLEFIKRMYELVSPGGVWINNDVVAPSNKNELVLAEFNKADGAVVEEPYEKIESPVELKQYLEELSTYSRFLRFAHDFRRAEGETVEYEKVLIGGRELVSLTMADFADFITKKDYLLNWQSEMHERFCFWDINDWREHIEDVGFELSEDSESYTNDWIIDNRFRPAVKIYKEEKGKLVEQDYPVTNVKLVARKR